MASLRKALDERTTTVYKTEVIKTGDQLLIPEKMTLDDAITLLKRRKEEDEKVIRVSEDFDAFPLDGAHALSVAMEEMFGWYGGETIKGGFFRPDIPPQFISVEITPTEKKQVPWGRFSLPGVEGYIQTAVGARDGRLIFTAQAEVKVKYQKQVVALFRLISQILLTTSLYRGKAFRVRFHDDKGEKIEMPEPRFLDVSHAKEENLVYEESLARMIKVNLFTPIEKMTLCKKFNIPTKRGILLAGPFGTGKTMAAYVSANKATENGVTFIYCEKADDFPDVCRFAQQYMPAVVFCEDIDRVVSGERSISMDEILNIIDGIESKSSELIVVLTTNDEKRINKAMLRPGRLDAVIHVGPPDARAVEKLIHLYAGPLIRSDEDLSRVGEVMKGQIPAVIRECVEGAKLAAVSRMEKDSEESCAITGADMVVTAETMTMQLQLLNQKEPKSPHAFEILGNVIGKHVSSAITEARKSLPDLDCIVEEFKSNGHIR